MSEGPEDGLATRTELFAGMAVFGSATPVSKIVTAAMPVFLASLLRVGLGALALAPFAWRQRGTVPSIGRKDWIIIGLIALFGMAGFSAFMGVMPVSALVLSYILLGEALQWMHLLGFATVFAGVILISWEHARKAMD